MNVQIVRGTPIQRPATTPITSSILDHATVVDKSGQFGRTNNDGLWPTYNCIDTLIPTPMCPDPTAVIEFESAPWVEGFEFALHGGVKCATVGLDTDDMKSELSRVFKHNEGKGVEATLLYNRFVEGSDATGDPVIDVTVGGGTASLEVALAALEGYAAAVYAGVPTIHMPRAAASLLGDRIEWRGGKAFTRMGSKVAMGGGYDDPNGPTSSATLYATGEIYVERSELLDVQTWTLPGDGSTSGDNMVLAVSERMYRVGVDCFVAKATGSMLPAGSGGGGGGGGAAIIDNGDGTWTADVSGNGDGTWTAP